VSPPIVEKDIVEHIVEQDIAEHNKLMAGFMKYLSIVSIILILLPIGFFSEYLNNASIWPLKLAIPFLFFAAVFSICGYLSYIDAFKMPYLLRGGHYHKLLRQTAIPLILFITGFTFTVIYLVMKLLAI